MEANDSYFATDANIDKSLYSENLTNEEINMINKGSIVQIFSNKPKLKGFFNPNSKCFLHVTLQMLFHNKTMRNNIEDTGDFQYLSLINRMKQNDGIFENDRVLTEIKDYRKNNGETIGKNWGNMEQYFCFYLEATSNFHNLFTEFIVKSNDTYKYFISWVIPTKLMDSIHSSLGRSKKFGNFFLIECIKHTNSNIQDIIPKSIGINDRKYNLYAIVTRPPGHYTIFLSFKNVILMFDSQKVFVLNNQNCEVFKTYISKYLSSLIYEYNFSTNFDDIDLDEKKNNPHLNILKNQIKHRVYSQPLKEIKNPLLTLLSTNNSPSIKLSSNNEKQTSSNTIISVPSPKLKKKHQK